MAVTDKDVKFLHRDRFQALLDVLDQAGYRCVGPRVKDGAVVYETVRWTEELPVGMRDRQAPGEYRLEDGGDGRLFAWANGAQGIKPQLFAPREVLWRAELGDDGRVQFAPAEPADRPVAVIGARACDLAAMEIQDRVFLSDAYRDPYYASRRRGLLLVAVNCTHPAETCFCVSAGNGPRASRGFDLSLTELDDGFVARAGSDAGKVILDRLPVVDAGSARIATADEQVEAGAKRQVRRLPDGDLRADLFANLEHPRWTEVASRCLGCGNCTMVCPTCFCHAEHAHPQLDGRLTEQVREWDSCFSGGHSYIHGFTVRADIRSRYRQWLTHKLGSWHDQFGTSGCVGCGRCITWCPVGIDITEEAAAICGEEPV
jgi:sulfhydrogenase subunit beta (sulfur reductase)